MLPQQMLEDSRQLSRHAQPLEDIEGASCKFGNCFKDDRKESVNWIFIGDGRGAFDEVNKYEFVGQGRGAWEQEIVVIPPRWNMRAIFVVVGICLSVVVVLILSAAYLYHERLLGHAQASSLATFDCFQGLDTWAADWPTEQQEWCCANANKGCKPTIQGCLTECDSMQHTFSCKYRIQWGADHKYKQSPTSCAQAHQMVMGQCPYCAGCTVEASGCVNS